MKIFKVILASGLVLATLTACAPKTETSQTETQNNQNVISQTNPPATMQTIPEKGDTIAILTTNMGEIKVLLYTKDVPETAKNFAELAKAKKYDGTIFHRVINNFMIQGGDFENRNGTGGYSYKGKGTSLKDEINPALSHFRGAVSMANSGPNTSGSQFFIVQNPQGAKYLDGGYSLFGFAYEGMDVVDKIATTQTNAGDKPLKDIVLEKVEIKTQE
ncbi:MAG: peptidylprolyl isomerase [Candidatus Gracilibacteria bacterium]|jgi:cyclophilin family peptidyl-prolyl cis-trans isomerase